MLVCTSFPDDAHPRVSFIEMPSRRFVSAHTCPNSKELKIYIHPQGTYVATMNEYSKGK